MNLDDENEALNYLNDKYNSGYLTSSDKTNLESNLVNKRPLGELAKQVYGRSNAQKQSSTIVPMATRSLGEESANQFMGGVEDIGGLWSGLSAWWGDVTGDEELKNSSIDDYMLYKQRSEQLYSPTIKGVEDAWTRVKDGDIGAGGRYLISTFSRQIPNLATSIIGGGFTGLVGKAAAKKIITEQMAKKLTRGTLDKAALNKGG